MLLGEHHGEDDSGSHLEIDDFQSNEIRQIFLTTLPDYLEPVRQMVEQLLEGGEGREVLLETLDKTLASISAAAMRIEIHDVGTIVERSRARLKRVDEIDDMELRADIFGDLRELEQMASAVSGEPSRAGGSSQTLVAAFSELGDVDRSALQSLTAAGLVTVDQLRMAEPSEVVAVTGLDPSVVDAIMAAVGRSSRAPKRAAPSPPGGSAAADPPAADLAEKLRAQVEAEVRVDEVRRDILELKTRLGTLAEELQAAERRAAELAERRAELRTEIAERLASLSAERAERARLERAREELELKLGQWQKELERLGRERASVDDEQRDAAAGIASLVADVERISRAVARAEERVTSPAGSRRGREGEP
jgi:DNA repair exonuclease SbcCD ATPase subunit